MSTLIEIREEMVEVWLAEANSDDYTDTILNDAINRAYRALAITSEAIEADFTQSTVASTKSYTIDSTNNLFIRPRLVTYDDDELVPAQMEDMVTLYGWKWRADATGTPEVWYPRGARVIELHPTPSAVKTLAVYGPQVPAELTADTNSPALPIWMHTYIAPGAYVEMLERATMRKGGAKPQNYDDAQRMWQAGLEMARRMVQRVGDLKVYISGTVPIRRWNFRRLRYDYETKGG